MPCGTNFCLVAAFSAGNTFPYPTGPTSSRSPRLESDSALWDFVAFAKPTHSRMGRFPSTLVLVVALVFLPGVFTRLSPTPLTDPLVSVCRLLQQFLVENIGIEPIMTEVGGVTVPCHTIAADSPLFVFTTPSVSL